MYPQVYELFRNFTYNPIDDDRFLMIREREDQLTEDEHGVINLVLMTFGEHTGRNLEMLTHHEQPWLSARTGYEDGVPSQETISKESIRDYFLLMNQEYDLTSAEGIRNYIRTVLPEN